METFKIKGGFELNGEITPQGAKNEALQVICATILTDDKVVINTNDGSYIEKVKN